MTVSGLCKQKWKQDGGEGSIWLIPRLLSSHEMQFFGLGELCFGNYCVKWKIIRRANNGPHYGPIVKYRNLMLGAQYHVDLIGPGGSIMNRLSRFFACLMMALTIASCGGSSGGGGSSVGGSGGGSSPPDYSSNATAAKLSSVVSVVGNTVTLNWFDSFPSGTTYTIKAQNSDSTYSTVATAASLGGTNAAETWQGGLTSATTYKIEATTGSTVTTLKTLGGQSTIAGGLSAAAPTIVLDKTEPVTGTVKLSHSDNTSYSSVTWSADGSVLGTGAATTGNPYNWDVSTQTIGDHPVTAKIQISTDTQLEIGRTVNVANPNIGISIYLQGAVESQPYTTGPATVRVTATANTGIASVSATLDGTTSLGTLTAPNTCYPVRICNFPGYGPNVYNFSVSAPTGNHTVRITATDNSGHVASKDVVIPIVTPPTITVSATSPSDAGFYYGTLTLSGTSASTSPGTVSTVVQIGGTQVYQTTSSTYNTSINLSGFTAGDYVVSVVATDSTNASNTKQIPITIASSSALAYAPLFSLTSAGTFSAGDAAKVAAREGGNIILYNAASNQSDMITLGYGVVYGFDNGLFYATGLNSGCSVRCVYQFSGFGGTFTNLSAANPFGEGTIYDLKAKNGYVMWRNDSGALYYVLYNATTHAYTKISPPAGVTADGDYDFYVSGGIVHAFFFAKTGASNTLYAWASDTATVTSFAVAGSDDTGVKTDGNRVVWNRDPVSTTSIDPYGRTVLSTGISGGTVTTISTNTYLIGSSGVTLKDNVLAWTEGNNSTHTTWASYNNGAKVAVTTGTLYGAGGGFVVYGENGKMYSWQASTGTRKLLLDTSPTAVLVTGTTVYFGHGSNTAGYAYRLTLN